MRASSRRFEPAEQEAEAAGVAEEAEEAEPAEAEEETERSETAKPPRTGTRAHILVRAPSAARPARMAGAASRWGVGIAILGLLGWRVGASLPSGFVARWSASDLRRVRDAAGNVIDATLASWTDTSGVFVATQSGSTTLRPLVNERAVHCHSSVQFSSGQYLVVPDDSALDPTANGFSVFMVSRTNRFGTGDRVLYKTNYADSYWEFMHGVAGSVSCARVQRPSSVPNDLGATSYLSTTDTDRFSVWGFTVAVNGAEHTLQGFLGNSSAGWTGGNINMNDNLYYGTLVTSSPLFIGLYNNVGFNGELLEVIIYGRTLSVAERADLHDHFESTYFLRCPNLPSTAAVRSGVDAGDACVGGKYWDQCRQACEPGFFRVAGTETHRCVAGQWTGSPLVCEPLCPRLDKPEHAASCTKQLVAESFDSTAGLSTWTISPAVPAAEARNFWRAEGGALVTDVANQCIRSPSVFHVSEPRWKEALSAAQELRIRATLRVDESATPSVGVVFRMLNELNHYRLLLRTNATGAGETQVLESVRNGVVRELARARVALRPDVSVEVEVVVRGARIRVFSNGTKWMDTEDFDFTVGTVGFVATGSGEVFDVVVTADCDGGLVCEAASDGMTCTHGCAVGYRAESGDALRACGRNASTAALEWLGEPLLCRIIPPTVSNQSFAVDERAVRDTAVGAPVEASLEARDGVVLFSLVGTGHLDGSGDPIFRIGACSGQIQVESAVPPYATQSEYIVTVRVTPNGDEASAVEFQATIRVNDLNDPPAFTDPVADSVRSIQENSAPGTPVGAPIRVADPDVSRSDSFTCSLSVDTSNGLFRVAVVASGCQIEVARAGLDYEGVRSFTVLVQAVDAAVPALRAQLSVVISVTDANDPPRMPSPQAIDVREADVARGVPLTFGLSATDPDAGASLEFGLVDTTPTFALDPSTGRLTWLEDARDWPSEPNYIVDGRLVVRHFSFRANVSDGIAPAVVADVRVYINAEVFVVERPVVRSIVGTPVLSTAGGDTVFFRGELFDRVVDFAAGARATYAPVDRSRVYTSPKCTIHSNESLSCVTAPGVGRNLRWAFVFDLPEGPVAGDLGSAIETSYAPPTITTYSSPFSLPTLGGFNLTITGTNFGADLGRVSIRYGPPGDLWMRPRRIHVVNHTRIIFETGEGQGRSLSLELTVDDQTVLDTYALYHAVPTITNIRFGGSTALTGISTRGSVLLYIDGTNFGPYIRGTAIVNPRATYGWSTGFSSTSYRQFTMQNCYRYPSGAISHRLMYCYLAQSVGRDLSVVVEVEGVRSSASEISCSKTFTHAEPRVTAVESATSDVGAHNGDTAGGQVIKLFGSNFGPVGSTFVDYVLYGRDLSASLAALDAGALVPPNQVYSATSCHVTSTSFLAGRETLECTTAPGTGTDLDWQVTIARQTAPVIPKATSYGAPIIASFVGTGASDGSTRGGEQVVIQGRNFGPGSPLDPIPAWVTVRYRMELKANDGSTGAVIANGATTLYFEPTNCTVVEPHTAIECTTDEGAGGNLQWEMVVDGQASRNPFTSYARPVIFNVTTEDGSLVTAARTSGGDVVYLQGANFGPPTSQVVVDGDLGPLVQSVSFGSPGFPDAYKLSSWEYEVLGHDLIRVVLPSGIGTDLQFRVVVAEQASPLADQTFSYAVPEIMSVNPSQGSTQSDPMSPQRIQIVARNLPLFDSSVNYAVLFGNEGDGSLGEPIPAQRDPLFFGWDELALLFDLPPGNGPRRNVQLIAYRGSDPYAGDRVVSQGVASFDYLPPQADFVTVVYARDDPAAAEMAEWIWGSSDGIRFVEIHGRDFGPGDKADWVRRLVQVRDTSAEAVTTEWVNHEESWDVWLVTWSHTTVSFLTPYKTAEVRLHIETAEPAWNAPTGSDMIVQETSIFSISEDVPTISALVMEDDFRFQTAGAETLSMEVLGSVLNGATTLRIVVRSPSLSATREEMTRNCPILNRDRTGTVAADPGLGPTLPSDVAPGVLRQACLAPGQTALASDAVCVVHCRMPEGQGEGASAFLVKNEITIPEAPSIPLAFARPTLDHILVVHGDLTVQRFDASRSLDLEVVGPTTGARMVLVGRNLGLTPVVSIGENVIGLRVSDWSRSGHFRNHTHIEFPIPEGAGLATLLTLIVGDQALEQDPAAPLKFRYLPPLISSMTTSAPTEGGSTMVVRGANFGPRPPPGAEPKVILGTSDRLGFASCAPVQYVSHFELRCTVPEGSGANLEVQVMVAGQTASSLRTGGLTFSYERPFIAAVEVRAEDDHRTVPGESWNATRRDRSLVLTAPTRGGFEVVLRGRNFGAHAPGVHCLFVQWIGAWKEGVAPVCDGVETVAGEGEIFDDGSGPGSRAQLRRSTPEAGPRDLVSLSTTLRALREEAELFGSGDPLFFKTHLYRWNHTEIRFRMPSGAGAAVITMNVRGSRPLRGQHTQVTTANAFPSFGTWTADPGVDPSELAGGDVRVDFESPVVEGLEAEEIPTSGGGVVTITGRNFGVQAVSDAELENVMTMSRTLPVREHVRAPLWHMRVLFDRACVSNATVLNPERGLSSSAPRLITPVGFLGCFREVLAHSHERITILTQSGVGMNKNVTVEIASTSLERTLTSNSLPFNYAAPLLDAVEPTPILMESSEDFRVRIIVRGTHFGEFAEQSRWTEEERAVEVLVNNDTCTSARRVSSTALGTRSKFDMVECTLGNVPVGRKRLSVKVAGQIGAKRALDDGSPFVVCKSGFYGFPGEVCLDCPFGAICRGYENRTHFYPQPEPRFFNLNGTMLGACPPEVVTPDRDVCIVACDPPQACRGDNLCALGYMSKAPYFRCATCAPGFYRRAGECARCPQQPWMLVVGYVLMVAFAAVVGYELNRRNVNVAFVSIGVDFFQVLAMFANSRVQWPAYIRDFFFILSAFNLNIEITAPECTIPELAYETKWRIIESLPLGAGGAFLFFFCTQYAWRRFVRGQRGRARLLEGVDQLISAFMVMFYFLYLQITRTSLDVFNCAPLVPPDGKEYLQVVFEECGKPGGVQLRLLPFAILTLLGYTVAYPVLVSVLFYRHRRWIMLDQLLRAHEMGSSEVDAHPNTLWLRKRVSKVYYAFKPDFFFWSIIILVRKFCIAFTALMFNRNPAFQLAVALLVMFASFTLQVKYSPFMSPAEYEAVVQHHKDTATRSPESVHALLAFDLDRCQARTRKPASHRVNWRNAAEALKEARLLLFNYNTVESILLGATVLITLAGIMFESGRFADGYYSDERDLVAGLTMFVIIVSVVYFSLVFIGEIVQLWRVAQAKEAERRAVSARKGKGAALASASMVGDRKFGQTASTFLSMLGVSVSKSGRGAAAGDDNPGMPRADGLAFVATEPVELSENPLALQIATAGENDDVDKQLRDSLDIFQPNEVPTESKWQLACMRFNQQYRLVEALKQRVEDLQRSQNAAALAEQIGVVGVAGGGGSPRGGAGGASAGLTGGLAPFVRRPGAGGRTLGRLTSPGGASRGGAGAAVAAAAGSDGGADGAAADPVDISTVNPMQARGAARSSGRGFKSKIMGNSTALRPRMD